MSRTEFPDWTVSDVVQQLQSLGLQKYGQAFLNNHINGEAFMFLTESHLKELGMKPIGHRLTLLNFISEWRSTPPQAQKPITRPHLQPLPVAKSDPSEEEEPPPLPPPPRKPAPHARPTKMVKVADDSFAENPFESRPKIGSSFIQSTESSDNRETDETPPGRRVVASRADNQNVGKRGSQGVSKPPVEEGGQKVGQGSVKRSVYENDDKPPPAVKKPVQAAVKRPVYDNDDDDEEWEPSPKLRREVSEPPAVKKPAQAPLKRPVYDNEDDNDEPPPRLRREVNDPPPVKKSVQAPVKRPVYDDDGDEPQPRGRREPNEQPAVKKPAPAPLKRPVYDNDDDDDDDDYPPAPIRREVNDPPAAKKSVQVPTKRPVYEDNDDEDDQPRHGRSHADDPPAPKRSGQAPPKRSVYEDFEEPPPQKRPPPQNPRVQSQLNGTAKNPPVEEDDFSDNEVADDGMPPPFESSNPQMGECPICFRHFAIDRLETHRPICERAHKAKKHVFDGRKMRLEGTEAAQFASRIDDESSEKKVKKVDFRSESARLQATLKGARSTIEPPPDDMVECPRCHRKFSEDAGKIHIRTCKKGDGPRARW